MTSFPSLRLLESLARRLRPHRAAAASRAAAGHVVRMEMLEGRRLFSGAGDIDLAFGLEGKARATVDRAHLVDDAYAVAVQSDGKIVLAGRSNAGAADSRFGLVRLTTDGKPDITFGTDGVVTETFGGADGAAAVLVQPDGKILVAGQGQNGFALARFDANGAPDASFGTGGRLTAPFVHDIEGTLPSRVVALMLQDDGRIVAVGTVRDDANRSVAVARFDANGGLDGTFATGGRYFDAVLGDARAAAIQPDGKILVATSDFKVVRLDAGGQADLSFGAGGVLTGTGINDVTGVALQADGSILVTGTNSQFDNDFALMRFDPLGVPDAAFNGGAPQLTDFGGRSNDRAAAVAVQPDGHIVVAGTSAGRFALAQYNADGSLDANFANAGRQTTSFSSSASVTAEARAIALQGDGKVLVAGTVPEQRNTGIGQTTIARVFGVTRYRGGASALTGSISGTIFRDADGDGVRDPGDTPLVGWTAYNDTDGDGRVDADEARAVTNADGVYLIDNLQPGSYLIRELRPDGWRRTRPGGVFPQGFYDVTVTAGRDEVAKDFGNIQEVGAGNPGDEPAPTNVAPVANRDTAVTVEQTAVDIDVLANDTDEGQLVPGSVGFAVFPSRGTIVINPVNGRVTYTPAAGFTGTDSFVYTVKDNAGATSGLAMVAITVNKKPGTEPPPPGPGPTNGPDLEGVVSGTLPAAVVGGAKAKASLSVLVMNKGNQPLNGPVALNLFVSSDTTFDAGDMPLTGVVKKMKLKAGASKTFKIRIASFPAVADGAYRVLARLDGTDLVTETNESNNVGAAPSAVTIAAPFVDLRGSFAVPLAGKVFVAGKKAAATILIENRGNVPATGTMSVALTASADASAGPADAALATIPVKLKVKAGAVKKQKLSFIVPLLTAGNYHMVMSLDSAKQIVEKDEGNNVAVDTGVFVSQ